jgi:hypothetical protein
MILNVSDKIVLTTLSINCLSSVHSFGSSSWPQNEKQTLFDIDSTVEEE